MSVEEKVKEIIIDQLGVDEKQVTASALFIDDLGAVTCFSSTPN
jgi:acyl carrier protein